MPKQGTENLLHLLYDVIQPDLRTFGVVTYLPQQRRVHELVIALDRRSYLAEGWEPQLQSDRF